MNENIPEKPTVFTPYVGGVARYHDTILEVAERGYEGFALTGSVGELDRSGSEPRLSVMEGELPTR
jgi:hypothetical protein